MDVIRTNEANCRDCYKCLRSCPVKAIRVERSYPSYQLRAQVDDMRCILDGHCIAICPQKAKGVRRDYPTVRDLIRSGAEVWLSLAPSFVAAFPQYRPGQIVAALKRLGFAGVQETAVGAEWVAAEHARLAQQSERTLTITSSCPAVVNLIEMYHPWAIPFLAPVVSPMIAHGRWLKAADPKRQVIFAGPCLAKHEEIHEPGLEGAIDHVLAFTELEQWWREQNIDPAGFSEQPFDGPTPENAVLFPLDGGLLRTAGLSTDMLDKRVATVSGIDNCEAFIAGLQEKPDDERPALVEMMVCAGGCIAGPLMPQGQTEDMYTRRRRVLRYRDTHPGYTGGAEGAVLPADRLQRNYRDRTVARPTPSEEEIRAILGRSGKQTAADELNCGACGYGSCREKAIAVFEGMADPEMCIPYMRVKAESLSNLIVASTPNGILVVDAGGTILDLNAAAERMFEVPRTVAIGKPVSEFMDAGHFESVLSGAEPIIRKEELLAGKNRVARMTIVRSERENVAIAIFEDITDERAREEKLLKVRGETLERAQEVIDKQMAVAQKIAGLLGETTAETKVLLTRLMRVMKDEGNGQ